jgi:hypothetical protein
LAHGDVVGDGLQLQGNLPGNVPATRGWEGEETLSDEYSGW